jgi:hypothetical protein
MTVPACRTLVALTAAIAFGATLQAACRRGTEPTGPTEWGSHRVTITGSVTDESSGPGAVFNRGPWWYMSLANAPQANSEWGLDFTWSSARPAAGATIPIGPPSPRIDPRAPDPPPPSTHVAAGVFYLRRSDDQFFSWTAEAGEIRILTSSPQHMTGTFELRAQQKDGRALGPITVTGTFDAVCQPAYRQGPC